MRLVSVRVEYPNPYRLARSAMLADAEVRRKVRSRSSGPTAATSYGLVTGRKSTRIALPATRMVLVEVSRWPLTAGGTLNTAYPIKREVYNVALRTAITNAAGGPGTVAALRAPGRDWRYQVIAALALIAGVVAGLLLEPTVPVALQPYLPIAVVAALDAVFGGVRAKLDGVFDDKQFVVSFVSNVLVAAFIVYLGDQLGVGGQLSTGVVVVLGVRIFGNVAAIRRHIFRA